jgi:hypothetical protein
VPSDCKALHTDNKSEPSVSGKLSIDLTFLAKYNGDKLYLKPVSIFSCMSLTLEPAKLWHNPADP